MKTKELTAWDKKADHANVEGTQKGFRATVRMKSGRVLASRHFDTDLSDTNASRAVDASYAAMKKWLAGWGVS